MTWTLDEVENRFLQYMEDNDHQLIAGHSVMSPTDDVLFTTAGMHPLTPYLHGQPHPMGRRLCDVQRCVRTTDIDEVGDNRHLTIFEMVGNWSLGDYFKERAIPQSMGLLTDVYGIDPEKLYVTVFAGLPDIGMGLDTEAVALWEQCFADRASTRPATSRRSPTTGGPTARSDCAAPTPRCSSTSATRPPRPSPTSRSSWRSGTTSS